MNQPQTTLVLASRSARRIELLRQIGVQCIIDPADIDESVRSGESPRDYVARLAREKAEAVFGRHPDRVVLGADTTVVSDGVSLGKPADGDEGVAMLQRLQDGWHDVLTAVACVSDTRIEQTVTCTRVKFRAVGHDEAFAYWGTGEPADKAGGYAIQGLGAMFVERIEGSYSGVVGLPLAETSAALRRLGVADALADALPPGNSPG
ncbi:MAG: Maf family protein [Pseudomonadota bacterium]